jgi:uncharacterized protein YkwD
MRSLPLLLCVAACGPIYSDPGQQPAAPAPAPSGPPGGAADPWRANEPAASTPEPQSPAPPPPRRPPPPPPRGGSLPAVSQALLDAHNRHRAQHCAAPLAWSPQLAQVAQRWANTLRDRGCQFGHSGGSYGENLAAGTTGTLDAEAVAGMWYEEVRDYKFPNGGFSMSTGHFTQLVWRATTKLGCAMSQCNGNDIWVCEYDPAGNVQGEYRDNVKPKGCR